MQRKLLRVKEAAAYLRISKNTLDRMRCQRRGPPYIRVGKLIYYDLEQLNLWLKANSHLMPEPTDPDQPAGPTR